MEFQSFKEAVIRAAQAAGIADYEIYYECGESTEIGAFQHEINEFSSGVSGGVCFRCVVDGKMGYAATEAITEDEAAALVERAASNARALEAKEAVFLCPGGQVYQTVAPAAEPLSETPALVSALLDMQNELYAADPAMVDGCSSQAIQETVRLAICNSRGLDVTYENHLSGLLAVAVVSDGTEMVNDYKLKIGDPARLDRAALAQKTAKAAKAKLGGEAAPTAVCPVVFSPGAMASLLQTYVGIFSAENAQKGLSKLGSKQGEQIAAPLVTLVDDPFCPDSPLPMPFDAEGCPTRKKNVIEGGVLATLLHNLKTANQAGCETTGNASKSGYAAPVGISPFAMYFAPGSSSEDALLEQAGNGVYINELGGLHAGANPVSGDFSLQSAGFLIENGKKTKPVKSFTVAGNFYDLLLKITALSDKVEFPMPTGSTLYGSPAVLVETLSIAGK